MKIFSGLLAATAPLVIAAAAVAQTADKKVLTLEGAKQVMAAAEAAAKEVNAPGGAIAIVDDGGNVLLVERLDNSFPASAVVSIGKARTAALFRKQTSFFEETINKGRTAMAALSDSFFTPLQGGVPILVNGQVVGAIGMSGAASAAQDEQVAMTAASAFAGH
jgi:glc operon protein GlcG